MPLFTHLPRAKVLGSSVSGTRGSRKPAASGYPVLGNSVGTKRAGTSAHPGPFEAYLSSVYFLPVVKLQILSKASGLPALSLTPLAPPFTVTLYFVLAANGEDGFNVTLLAVVS